MIFARSREYMALVCLLPYILDVLAEIIIFDGYLFDCIKIKRPD